jgi:hypothetical protein
VTDVTVKYFTHEKIDIGKGTSEDAAHADIVKGPFVAPPVLSENPFVKVSSRYPVKTISEVTHALEKTKAPGVKLPRVCCPGGNVGSSKLLQEMFCDTTPPTDILTGKRNSPSLKIILLVPIIFKLLNIQFGL